MSKLTRKRQILTATLALALASAVLVNWYYNKNQPTNNTGEVTTSQNTNLGDSIYVNGTAEGEENKKDDGEDAQSVQTTLGAEEYFAEAQLKRTNAHDETLDKVSQLIENGDSEAAQKLLDSYTKAVKLETDIENLITAKVNCECLAVINDGQARIVVESEGLDDLYLLQITDIVSAQANISPENIVIIPAK